jgi:hypothetical protein
VRDLRVLTSPVDRAANRADRRSTEDACVWPAIVWRRRADDVGHEVVGDGEPPPGRDRLPLADPEATAGLVDVAPFAVARLSNAHAGLGQRRQQQPVARGMQDDRFDRRGARRLDHRALLPRQSHASVPRRVRVDGGIVEQPTQRREIPLHRGRLDRQTGDPVLHVRRRDPAGLECAQPRQHRRDVAAMFWRVSSARSTRLAW